MDGFIPNCRVFKIRYLGATTIHNTRIKIIDCRYKRTKIIDKTYEHVNSIDDAIDYLTELGINIVYRCEISTDEDMLITDDFQTILK